MSRHAELLRKTVAGLGPLHDHEESTFASAADYIERLEAQKAELVAALTKIADHEGRDPDRRYVDEWTEAAAFTECQNIARAALNNAKEG